jgi:hypothetical protein
VRWILTLQEYSFDVIYRSGKKNVVADALSRLEMEPGSKAILSLQIQDSFNTGNIAALIKEEQRKDKFCSDLLNYLRNLELTDDEKLIHKLSLGPDLCLCKIVCYIICGLVCLIKGSINASSNWLFLSL